MNHNNIIFDLGNVLVGLQPQAFAAAYEAIGMGSMLRRQNDEAVSNLVNNLGLGTISIEAFCEEARRLTRSAATNEQIIAATNALLTTIPNAKKETLLRLRASGHRVFLLSNTNDIHWEHCERHLFAAEGKTVDHYFDRVFLSQRLHLQKPDPAIFREVLSQTGIAPAETLFIDDLPENCAAAEELGIHTFHNASLDAWLQLPL